MAKLPAAVVESSVYGVMASPPWPASSATGAMDDEALSFYQNCATAPVPSADHPKQFNQEPNKNQHSEYWTFKPNYIYSF